MHGQQCVEFVGGPYDGYRHQIGAVAQEIAEDAALPVSENLIRAVNGEEHGPLYPYHRVALYHLSFAENQQLQYLFVGEKSHEGTLF
ncbi:MAG TPA: hypothetical protein VHZ24_07920 [Pirellulales bacterium]|nr:hypothetical protein [Pirellulales bacterium]